ncbi:putative alpha-1,2-mannosidase [Phyllobacterium endophyticum]|uniref:GH92 family glycosyl hydrolase n=1 Tax=Phyllobacterium endophyticum TaxID=1149773 RepID=UPI001858A361|nr:GH92 family glycosyl hydrolase [Phyllobacterium endophyticum]MBB3238083.1 putative alpha-1,2-mannosidase [Phyllobacterium endophyticum]
MTLRRIFVAGLLASTMLTGCDGDDKSPPADTQSNGAFEALTERVASLETGRKADGATIAELRDSLAQFRAELDKRIAGQGARLDGVETRVSGLETAQKALEALLPQVEKLQVQVAQLQAEPKISKEDATRIAGLEKMSIEVIALRTDLVAAIATSQKDIGAIKGDIENHRLALTKTTNAAMIETLTARIAEFAQKLETASKLSAALAQEFTKRFAELEAEMDGLRNPRVDMALTQFVNAFVGTTDTETGGGHSGNLNPGAQTPFGMVSFGPDTKGSGQGWGKGSGGYYYDDKSIQFFSMTHLNGPGCRGQGAVAMLPKDSGSAISTSGISYNHANEKAEPGYYQVKFDNGINSEFTATTRTGMTRFTFADKDKAFLIIDSSRNNTSKDGGSSPVTVKLADDKKSVSGQAIAPAFCGGTWKQPVYFHAAFDKPLRTSSVDNDAATLQFDLADADKSVQVKIGISSVSAANAKLNLETENAGWSFDAVKERSLDIWNQRLNTIQLDLARPEEFKKVPQDKQADATNKLTQFYTALYRVYSGPTVFSDVNGEYRSMKQVSGGDLPVRATENVANYKFKVDGKDAGYKTHYSGLSMWDSYRSQAQLLAWIAPDEASDMMQSLVADAQQCGAFPHWVDGSEDTTPMEGDHAPNVVAGSYVFGAKNFDLENARKFMKRSAFDADSKCNDKSSAGSGRLAAYLAKNYLSARNSDHASSNTIEMITTDQSIGSFLAGLPSAGGDQADITTLFNRASNWKNIFDDSADQMRLRAKDDEGNWASGEFHESTEENYIWAFGHDWTALIDKLGGKQKGIERLNTLFSYKSFSLADEPSGIDLNGGEGSSGYYIGNEPAFQTPWAYNWAGSPKHAQYIIPVIMRKNFSLKPGGLPGNDDMGATSGWYVWSALGLYPVIPSAPGMAVSTPQFSGATVWLGNGKKLRIETDKQAMLDDMRYISEMKLGDAEYKGTWLPLDKIRHGGKLSFKLSDKPTEWGSAPELTPPSGPAADYSKSTAKEASSVQIIDAPIVPDVKPEVKTGTTEAKLEPVEVKPDVPPCVPKGKGDRCPPV